MASGDDSGAARAQGDSSDTGKRIEEITGPALGYAKISDPAQLRALLDAVLLVESDLDLDVVLHRVVEAACALTGARYGALGVLDTTGTALARFVHVGMDDETVARIGHLPEGLGVLGQLIIEAKPLRLEHLSLHPSSVGFPPGHPPMSSFLGVPLLVHGEVYGNLYLTEKQHGAGFTDADEVLAVALATAAGISVENARLHARLADLTLAAERDRMARDLHDTVIQRLFAVGLQLQGMLSGIDAPDVHQRVSDAVTAIDDTIRQIRTTIFALEDSPATSGGVRTQVLEVCSQAAPSLGFDPEVRFSGSLDRLVPDHVAVELLATLREALSNVARHAGASRVTVDLSADEEVTLEVRDNGGGPGQARSGRGGGHGLPNMAERAQSLGGSFTFAAHPGGGAVATWRVPLAPHRSGART